MPVDTSAARARYTSDTVVTASPARLLVLLYDRLVRDLVTAERAVLDRDFTTASSELIHAQSIVLELRSSLQLDVWDGAAGLSALYTYLHRELVGANVKRDAQRVAACRQLVEPLRDAWRTAALESTRQSA